MNRELQQWFMRSLLVGTAIVGPSLLALQLVRAAGAPAQHLRGPLRSNTLLLAQSTAGRASPTAINSPPSTSPITAVLYITGSSKVSWNAKEFAVNNGSYAYVGGETIQMAPGSIGLLQLSDGSRVFICGGSTVSLSRSPSGAHVLNVARGSSRFSFKANNDFTVRANHAEIRPAAASSGAPAGEFEGEVSVRPDGGCVVCELARDLQISAGGASGPPAQSEDSGRIFAVAPATQAQSQGSISAQAIPAAAMPASLSSGAAAGAAFLCQCEDLQRKADELTRLQVAAAQNGTVVIQPESVAAEPAPAAALAGAPDALAPPVAPPEAPPIALAEPGAPDPFDPNVLPPPAAGEPTEPIVVVAPPAVPRSGSGGGGIASPS